MDAIKKKRAKGPKGNRLLKKKDVKVSAQSTLSKITQKRIMINHRLYDLSLSIHFDLMSI